MEGWLTKPRSQTSKRARRCLEDAVSVSSSFDHLRYSFHTAELALQTAQDVRRIRAELAVFALFATPTDFVQFVLRHVDECIAGQFEENTARIWAAVVVGLLKYAQLSEADRTVLQRHSTECTDSAVLIAGVAEANAWRTHEGKLAISLATRAGFLSTELGIIVRTFRALQADLRFGPAPARPKELQLAADNRKVQSLLKM
eukprot:TRINITY_DN76541_c0_g1_i1.p1 TRINITY_DN76541_c0_g1~~TRINITY_DN76541_c0_g1_i1.p1  ORF type:complete len:201 (+),score=18.45 TRINITY_DN76541_c0_g1_i1:49-651(+)